MFVADERDRRRNRQRGPVFFAQNATIISTCDFPKRNRREKSETVVTKASTVRCPVALLLECLALHVFNNLDYYYKKSS